MIEFGPLISSDECRNIHEYPDDPDFVVKVPRKDRQADGRRANLEDAERWRRRRELGLTDLPRVFSYHPTGKWLVVHAG